MLGESAELPEHPAGNLVYRWKSMASQRFPQNRGWVARPGLVSPGYHLLVCGLRYNHLRHLLLERYC